MSPPARRRRGDAGRLLPLTFARWRDDARHRDRKRIDAGRGRSMGDAPGGGGGVWLRGRWPLEHNPVRWNRLRCVVARRSVRRGAKGDAGASTLRSGSAAAAEDGSAERRNAAGARPGATRRAGVFRGHGFVAELARRHRYVLRPAPARGTKFLRRSQFNLTGLCSRRGYRLLALHRAPAPGNRARVSARASAPSTSGT